jgi:hypothetical protein
MVVASADRTRPQLGPTPGYVGRAFGLELASDFALLGLERRSGKESAGNRSPTVLRRATAGQIDAGWTWEGANRVLARNRADGSNVFTVDAHPKAGYRTDAPGYGRFLVSPDGLTVRCALSDGPRWRGYRPLFAQVLPMASALRGFGLLHASAAVVDGVALAFTGYSGAGKSTLALHLLEQGAELLADDVVALSPTGDGLLAHPGTSFTNVAPEQLEALTNGRRPVFGPEIGRSDKVHVSVDRFASAPAPLAALYVLDRRPDTPRLRFEPLTAVDPRLLLGASFLRHLEAPAWMAAQLDVCARISAGAVVRVSAPVEMKPRALASAVLDDANRRAA